MAKFIFILFLAGFLAFGAFCFFFINVDSAVKIQSDSKGVKGGNSGYDSFILKEDFNIRSLLSRIVSDCRVGDYECIAIEAFKYVQNDILPEEKGGGGHSPKTVLMERKGDVADRAVLLASFLENGGIKTSISSKNGLPIVYACGLDVLKLYSAIVTDMHKIPLAKRDIVLKKGQIWAVNLQTADSKPVATDIYAKSSKPFDMLLFPDETEMKAYLKNKDGRFLSHCSASGTDSVEMSCLAPAGGMLLFISDSDGNTFSGSVMKGGVLLSDIKSMEFEGNTCVPMDVTLKDDLTYPGFLGK